MKPYVWFQFAIFNLLVVCSKYLHYHLSLRYLYALPGCKGPAPWAPGGFLLLWCSTSSAVKSKIKTVWVHQSFTWDSAVVACNQIATNALTGIDPNQAHLNTPQSCYGQSMIPRHESDPMTLLGCIEVSLIMHLCFSDCLLSFSFNVWVRMTLPMCLCFDVCVWVGNSSLHNKNFTFLPQQTSDKWLALRSFICNFDSSHCIYNSGPCCLAVIKTSPFLEDNCKSFHTCLC